MIKRFINLNFLIDFDILLLQKTAKPIGICGFCLGDNEKNANGVPEEMIHCAECVNSGRK